FSAIFSLSLFYYPATPPRYILSLHDALPIFSQRFPKLWTLHNRIHKSVLHQEFCPLESFGKFLSDGLLNDSWTCETDQRAGLCQDRKSTRLNSSHVSISYAVFCLKKKRSDNT